MHMAAISVGGFDQTHQHSGTGVFGGLTLGVVEVGRDGDDGVGDLLAEVSFSGFLHLG